MYFDFMNAPSTFQKDLKRLFEFPVIELVYIVDLNGGIKRPGKYMNHRILVHDCVRNNDQKIKLKQSVFSAYHAEMLRILYQTMAMNLAGEDEMQLRIDCAEIEEEIASLLDFFQ